MVVGDVVWMGIGEKEVYGEVSSIVVANSSWYMANIKKDRLDSHDQCLLCVSNLHCAVVVPCLELRCSIMAEANVRAVHHRQAHYSQR